MTNTDPTVTQARESAEQAAESREAGKKKPQGIDRFRRQADRLKAYPNLSKIELIERLDGNSPTVEQLERQYARGEISEEVLKQHREAMTALEQALGRVLVKLAKKGTDISKIDTTEELELAVTTSGIKLDPTEAAAVENLNRIAGPETGPTAKKIREGWPERNEAAQLTAGRGITDIDDKAIDWIKKNPLATAAFAIVGVAGLYFSYQAIKTYRAKKKAKETGKKPEGKETSWFKKEIMYPLAIALLAGIGGKYLTQAEVRAILAKYGLAGVDIQNRAASGTPPSADEANRMRGAGRAIQDRINENRRQADQAAASGGGTTGADTAGGGHEGAGPVLESEEGETAPPAPSEETEEPTEWELLSFGHDLLIKEGAEKLADNTYLYLTGETKTFFRFYNGEWQWASEKQKSEDDWKPTGAHWYLDKAKYAKANRLSEKLAAGPESAEATSGRIPTEISAEIAEKYQEEAFDVVKNSFIALYFNGHREIKNPEKNDFRATINDLAEVHISKIIATYEQYKNERSIPKSALSVKTNISEKHLFLLVEGLVRFSKFAQVGSRKEKDPTVKKMLETLHEHPALAKLEGLDSLFNAALQKGNFHEALQVLGTSSLEHIKKYGKSIITRLNEELGIDMTELNREENKKEKEVYFRLIGYMFRDTKAMTDPQATIDNQLRAHEELREHTLAIKKVKEFLTAVQERTPALYEKAQKRFELPGHEEKWLRKGLPLERLTLSSACELLTLEAALEDEGEWATDLIALNVLLRDCEVSAKNKYIGHLASAFLDESIDIKLPAIKNLKKYAKRAAEAAGLNFSNWILDLAEKLDSFSEDRPGNKPSAQMAEQMKTSPILSFGREGLGTGLEITSSALAVIIATLGLQDEIADCENGEEFLALVRLKGGNVGYYEGYEGLGQAGLIVINTGWNIFVARPGKTLIETFRAASDFSGQGLIDGAKIWISSSAFFVGLGGTIGFLKPARTPYGALRFAPTSRLLNAIKGAGRGLTYPYKAPLMAARAAKRTIHTVAAGAEGTKAAARGAIDSGRRVLNWSRDVIHYHSLPGQNVENLMMTGNRLRYHFGMVANELSPGISKRDSWLIRKGKMARARATRAYRTTRGLFTQPGTTLRMLVSGDFHRMMSEKFAIRFVRQYNDFFDEALFEIPEMTSGKLQEVKQLYDRFEGAFLRGLKDNPGRLDELSKLTGKFKGRDLARELAAKLKDYGLTPSEARALAERMSKGKGEQIISQLRRTVGQMDNVAARTGVIRERFRRPTDVERARSFGKTSEAVRQTERNLASLERRISAAEREINTLNRMRKGPKFKGWDAKLQARLDAARKIIADGKAAEAKLQKTLTALRRISEAEDAYKAAEAAGNASRMLITGERIRQTTQAAEASFEASNKAFSSVGKLGKAGTALKWGGGLLVGAGALVSAGTAVSSGYEAITTDVEGRGKVKGAEAALWGANAAADAAAVAVIFGAEGTVATGLSAAAVPLAPITYAGWTVAETLYEDTKQDYEWVQGNPYQVLHHFYTSINYCSLGDAWVTGTHLESPEKRLETKRQTMRKIFRGLVAIQKDPGLLSYIMTEPPSKAKDKAIEERIAKNYTKYHEFYFSYMHPQGVNTYEDAKQFVLDAQMFDKIMETRDQKKAAGQPFILISDKQQRFDLHLDRYDVIIDAKNNEFRGKKPFNPLEVVQAFKDGLVRLVETDEIIKGNLERMDTSYLIRLYVQIRLKLENEADAAEIKKEEGLFEFLSQQQSALEGYLAAKRGVNLVFDATRPEYHQPKMSLKQIQEHLQSFGSGDNKAYLDFERNNYSMTPALQALYRLGQYFGYGGPPSEEHLKKFFNPDGAEYRGLYWNGEQWMLNERGYEFDDPMGQYVTSAMIERVIARMREQPDNILAHRQDAIFLDARDYEAEVKKMAQCLENGLREGAERGYKRSGQETTLEHDEDYVAPPRGFDSPEIDYDLPKEGLMADYKRTMEYIVNETVWNNLKYNIKNENTIIISRKDGSASTEITRYGGYLWKLEGGYASDLSLVQAVSLANLVNWADQWIQREKLEGASESPFLVDGSKIEFDENWAYFNTTFMEHWTGFYGRIGISKEQAVNTLNAWYRQHHRQLPKAA